MPRFSKSASALALAATLSMAATPLVAAELPTHTSRASVPVDTAWNADSENAERHRGYRNRRYRNNRVDAGDVLAGVLIIGGIAAVASAASRNNRDNRYPDRDYRTRDQRYDYRNQRSDSRYEGGEGLNNAVNLCVREIERNARVDQVDQVDRSGDGWRVTGSLYNGDGFTCRIGNDGRISDVDYGTRDISYEDRQWDDDSYASAWDQVDNGNVSAQPAYPGGPVDDDLSDY